MERYIIYGVFSLVQQLMKSLSLSSLEEARISAFRIDYFQKVG